MLIRLLPQWQKSKFLSFHPINTDMKLSSINANLATVQVFVAKNLSLFVGVSLSEPHTSVTALHTRVYVRLSMDRPLTVYFKSAHSNILRWLSTRTPHWHVAKGTLLKGSACEREWEWRLFKLNALATRTTTYFLDYGTSLTIAWQGRVRVTVGQQDVRWLQVRAWHDRSYIAWISLLGHGLTVKLSPCPCS